ncbi:MAG: hypothetical protein A3B90_02095 [Candidatus Magasanikbacteria bacterium RIFCSPHIGHO2_02_FULL_41_13]|uniref:Uncharacterized protein n=1 Tax=Candidatus Magasanikbacteria bacterium RIFCSPHIGHO2_02_FULL_41_13 TaxID=1798676 RepID=A0A1F6M644_9BACT|nr:MAG: hypothetical protein A3B90_02095 [Candidatus Magasanikbacteria bacterium RIFCSPHIGHO2_02_FULL_41_13]
MNEVFLKRDTYNNEVIFDGKNIYFAHGRETSSLAALLIFASLVSFAFILSFFQYLAKKINFLSADFQFYISLFLSFVFCLGISILIYKKFTAHVKVPPTEREDVIIVDTESKKVTIREKNKVVDSYTFGKDDYFWYPRPSHSKNITTYRLVFVHNNTQYASVASGSVGQVTDLRNHLSTFGFPIRDDNAPGA